MLRIAPVTLLMTSLLSGLSSLAAHGQTVRGHVVEVGTGTPIGFVDIIILSGPAPVAVVETDSLGHFELELPGPGSYVLIARRTGYTDLPPAPFSAAAGRMLDIVVRMSQDAIVLDPLEVLARAQPRHSVARAVQRIQENRRFGIGVHMTRDEIEKTTRTEVSDLIQSMTPTVQRIRQLPRMVANGRGGYSPEGVGDAVEMLAVMRRGELCPLRVFLDGVDVTAGGIDGIIAPHDMAAVEVYPGAFSRDGYVDPAGCGIALIWSAIQPPNSSGYRRTLLGSSVLLGLVAIVLLAL
jgi:hypothetical protein